MAEIRVKETGTIKLFENDNTSSVTIASPASLGADRTITLPDGDVTLVAGTLANTPAFQAYLSGNQTLSNNTLTKLEHNTEIVDTDSAYDNTTNYRFTVPAGGAGKYFLFWRVFFHTDGSLVTGGLVNIYKNGGVLAGTNSAWTVSIDGSTGCEYLPMSGSTIVDLAATDYIEIYGKGLTVDASSDVLVILNSLGFGGYKLIGV